MKHSNPDGVVLQSNLLQAFQKNKIMQGKLSERNRSYYVQLLRDMQTYDLKEKFNRELLYTWKKEAYVRQLKLNLQEYERKRFGARDAYYEYQAKNLDSIMAGQSGLVIPPIEEERRLRVNAKYRVFLEQNPVRGQSPSSPVRAVQSAAIAAAQAKAAKEEEDAKGVEQTWSKIHAQSAIGVRRRKADVLPAIQRSSTMDEIRRSKALTKSLVPPTVAIVSGVLVTTTPDILISVDNSSSTPPPTRTTLPEGIEPILITSETLQKQTRSDLVTMRSVRRPQKNPTDLNLVFEARKRIYQINKRAYDYQLCQRKCGLQYNSQFDRPIEIDPADDDDKQLAEMSDATRRRCEERHHFDRTLV